MGPTERKGIFKHMYTYKAKVSHHIIYIVITAFAVNLGFHWILKNVSVEEKSLEDTLLGPVISLTRLLRLLR